VVKDPTSGEIVKIRCHYDPATGGGNTPDGRRVKSTIHWVSAAHALDFEARLHGDLFLSENAGGGNDREDFTASINPNSLKVRT
jgi:glutaminyl-tRNA synthetase